MSFSDKVDALHGFFGITDTSKPLADRIVSMNSAMGITGEGALPQQVDALLAATGLRIASDGETAAPVPAASSDSLTSLGGIGTRPDPKLTKHLAKHKARQVEPLKNERGQKIVALRKLMEGGPGVPDKYKHADFLPANEEGMVPTQIAGGISYSKSQVQDWESPSFFKDVATVQATKPIMRRCNPVGGKYPEFR